MSRIARMGATPWPAEPDQVTIVDGSQLLPQITTTTRSPGAGR